MKTLLTDTWVAVYEFNRGRLLKNIVRHFRLTCAMTSPLKKQNNVATHRPCEIPRTEEKRKKSKKILLNIRWWILFYFSCCVVGSNSVCRFDLNSVWINEHTFTWCQWRRVLCCYASARVRKKNWMNSALFNVFDGWIGGAKKREFTQRRKC